MKNCLFCGKKITNNHPKAKNVKFCSAKCRNKNLYWNKGGKQAQAEYVNKKREEDDRLKIPCLICGKLYRQVGSHIWNAHGITAREYRKAYGFDVKKGQLPPDYRDLKATQAIECGGARNLKKGKKYWFKPGDKKAGRYKRSPQTKKRLRDQLAKGRANRLKS